MQGNREFIYLVPARKHFADYRPYDLKIVPHTTVATLSDYSTMSAAGVTHFFHGQVHHAHSCPTSVNAVNIISQHASGMRVSHSYCSHKARDNLCADVAASKCCC